MTNKIFLVVVRTALITHPSHHKPSYEIRQGFFLFRKDADLSNSSRIEIEGMLSSKAITHAIKRLPTANSCPQRNGERYKIIANCKPSRAFQEESLILFRDYFNLMRQSFVLSRNFKKRASSSSWNTLIESLIPIIKSVETHE